MACSAQQMTKDPNAKLLYGVNWTDWLGDGETISESAWYVDGVLVDAESEPVVESGELLGYTPANDTTQTTIWLKNGIVRSYPVVVTNRVTTNLGQVNDASLHILIAEQ